MSKEQSTVSRNIIEGDVISLGTGLCMEELPALILCACIVDVFSPAGGDLKHMYSHVERLHTTDSLPPNIEISKQRALLVVVEDNEAVIEKIIKGRSSNMRHVSKNVVLI